MKRWLRKWLPNHDSMNRDKNTRWIARWLSQHPYLWALNRKTVAKGVAAGLLVAFIPIPAQIILSSVLALFLRANLPIAVVSTLVSNPLTFVPINLLIYHIGVSITGVNGSVNPPPVHALELHWESMTLVLQESVVWFKSLGKSYLIGLVVFSISASITGFCLVHLVWRIYLWLQIRSRKNKLKK
jgi:uncharacterized protein (DUF2062 family)